MRQSYDPCVWHKSRPVLPDQYSPTSLSTDEPEPIDETGDFTTELISVLSSIVVGVLGVSAGSVLVLGFRRGLSGKRDSRLGNVLDYGVIRTIPNVLLP